MDIVERLRAREYFDTWDSEFVSKEAADEIDKLREDRERLREVLRMWVKFWEADGEDNVFEPLLAEEAMEATRSVL